MRKFLSVFDHITLKVKLALLFTMFGSLPLLVFFAFADIDSVDGTMMVLFHPSMASLMLLVTFVAVVVAGILISNKVLRPVSSLCEGLNHVINI